MTLSLANGFLATLSILASGYVLYTAPISRIWWPRVSGSVLYFHIITTGFAFLYLCYTSIYLLIQFKLAPSGLTIGHAPFWTFPLALVLWAAIALLWKMINLWFWIYTKIWMYTKKNIDTKQRFTLKSMRQKELEQFVYQKLISNEMIMVTLENSKVYIGWPVEIINDEDSKWLGIVPMWSGYRDEQINIHIETDYSSFFDYGLPNQDSNSPKPKNMLISINKIVTVQPFDAEVFVKFNPNEPKTNNIATS